MSEQVDIFEDVSNPLDSVEDILAGQQWSFSRMTPDELMVDVSGKLGTYRMIFYWQEEYSALQFYCHYDMSIPPDRQDLVALALSRVNSTLWLGHFTLPNDTYVPCFRHTSLFRGQTQNSGADHLHDLMDIALNECERYFAMFRLMANEDGLDESLLHLALQDTAGEA